MTRAQRSGGGPALTRRHLLALAAAGSAAWMVPQLAGSGPSAKASYLVPLPGPLPGEPLRTIPELRLFPGAAGIRTGYLTAAAMPRGNVETGALSAPALAYNGSFPGTLLRLREGEPARVIFATAPGT